MISIPRQEPNHPRNDEEAVPEPDDSKHLIIDHVEVEDTDCVLLVGAAGPAVVNEHAGGHLGEHLAHRIQGGG